jgi:hypothetical protein
MRQDRPRQDFSNETQPLAAANPNEPEKSPPISRLARRTAGPSGSKQALPAMPFPAQRAGAEQEPGLRRLSPERRRRVDRPVAGPGAWPPRASRRALELAPPQW